jgi:hypothetical protein
MSPALTESKTIFNVFQKMFKWFKKKINTERKKYSSEPLHFVYSENKILPWGLEYITIQNYYILFCIPRVTI